MTYPVQIRNLRRQLTERFRPPIEMSDQPWPSERKEEQEFLSRAVAALAVKHETTCSDQEATLSVMDGRDDWGIDAVAVEDRVTHHHITLVQAKWSDKANAGFGHSEVDRLFRGLDFLLNLEFSRFNNRIERHVDALEKALDAGSPKVT